jgi:hypothetical protein
MHIRCWHLIAVFALLAYAGANEQRSEQRVYSDVQYNGEGGDLLGTELELTIHDGRVDGTLKTYEGGCADPVQVTGTLAGSELHVCGQSNAYGRTEIAGAINGGYFSGSLRVEKAKASEKIRLKKIARPHC